MKNYAFLYKIMKKPRRIRDMMISSSNTRQVRLLSRLYSKDELGSDFGVIGCRHMHTALVISQNGSSSRD